MFRRDGRGHGRDGDGGGPAKVGRWVKRFIFATGGGLSTEGGRGREDSHKFPSQRDGPVGEGNSGGAIGGPLDAATFPSGVQVRYAAGVQHAGYRFEQFAGCAGD